MANIGQLLDKLEANLTSFYDKAEEKGIVIDGARNTENLVLVAEQIGSSGGGEGGVVELSTPEEMEAFKSAENVGKYAKYVGETTDTYTNGAIYSVVEEGGNIVLLNKDNYVVGEGYCIAMLPTPLSIPEGIVGGDTVKVYFSIDGGAEQSADCIITDAGSFRYIDGVDGSGMVTLLDNDDATYVVAGYLDMNPFAGEAGQAYMGMAMLKEGTSLPSDYIPSINLLYIAKEVEGEETLYIKSEISYAFKKYVYLQSSWFAIATDKDIRANYVAYNYEGNIVTGSLMNPERITSQEHYEQILSNDNGGNQYIYRIDIDVGNFVSGHGVTAKKYSFEGQRWLSPVYSLEEIGEGNAIGWGNKKLELNRYDYARPYAFAYCSTLQTVDFINPNGYTLSIPHHLFYGCSQLTKVIFRDSSVLDSSSDKTGIFDETPISQGVGYIYVPDTYVENFKQNQYFAPYANQIKPLSEYVEE